MISYRQADLADRLKKPEPVSVPSNRTLRQRQIDDLNTRAPGHCERVYLRSAEEQFNMYGSEDPSLYVNICSDASIEPLNSLLYGSDLVGKTVVVHDPSPGDQWSHSFSGTINDFIEDEKLYIIEDQDSDFYQMTRDRFDVAD